MLKKLVSIYEKLFNIDFKNSKNRGDISKRFYKILLNVKDLDCTKKNEFLSDLMTESTYWLSK